MQDFEKMGVFYLGRLFDQEQRQTRDELLLYDSKDLTTHAVCVGMTGSGKTGLGIALLEEAAVDGIPALVIDPKGDMGNMMLSFPELRPVDFAPWVDPDAAARKGLTAEAFAGQTADMWRNGLSEWGQDASRISRFRGAVDIAIYTPGSTSGLSLSVLRSLAAPAENILADSDALRDRISAAVSGYLALLGIQADPIRSREHILLSSILYKAWTEGRSLDLTALIGEIQSPPFDRVGVFDIESFFPSKDRLELAMMLNNLLASPGFSAWMEGEPLDIGGLLYTPQGKPRISILSIAHLSDSERMFFVTLLLNEVVAWMRSRPGTSSLRALLYMDEIFGYFPPTASPPSKIPMLTLLKQARAYGLGVVLATQNPVDLDYKGLSNTGTWFIGRLQTERDKMRVLEGLEGASQASGFQFQRAEIDRMLSSLGKRVFLMHNVHEDGPVLFQTRWVLSYLRGPLTRMQIKTLMEPYKAKAAAEGPPRPAFSPVSPTPTAIGKEESEEKKPPLPSGIDEVWIPVTRPPADGERIIYRPGLLGQARLHFVNVRSKIDTWISSGLVASLSPVDPVVSWEEADYLSENSPAFEFREWNGAGYGETPAEVIKPSAYRSWKALLNDFLYRSRTLDIWECKELKQFSQPGEGEGDFRGRLAHYAREKRDLEIEALRKKYSPKLAAMEERLRRAQIRVEKEKTQYSHQKVQTAVSLGATVLGALFGRKAVSTGTIGRATTSMRGVGRAAREKDDIARALREVQTVQSQLQELESEFQTEAAALKEGFSPEDLELTEIRIRPRKSDISVADLKFSWLPWIRFRDGLSEPNYKL